jgi:hypothetical protein
MTGSPFSPQHVGPLPEKLKELEQPMHEVLAGFVHGCSPDPATRTAATAALVLGLWQLGGKALTPQIPSMLLLRPEGTGPDPIDEFVRTLVDDERNNEPRVQKEGLFMHRPIEVAPRAMANAMFIRRSLGQNIRPGDLGRRLEAQAAEEKFRAARVTAHGHGRSRRYHNAWHPDYGLLTDADDQLILRLNHDEDRSAFCHDFLNEPGKIVYPQGLGANLFPARKTVTVSGALTADLWSGPLAEKIFCSGMPFFVLPHFADTPLREKGLNALACFAMIWKSTPLPRVVPSLRLPGSDWVRHYHRKLLEHLAVLPLQSLFPVLQAVHQLEGVCKRIVGAARGPSCTDNEAIALYRDLYHHTFRGIVISMASQLWFGLGLMPGEEHDDLRKKAERLLRRLRDKGPVTKTDLLKNFHLTKLERDALLEQLAGQGLIRVDGGSVAATSYREFVEGLYAREEFPAVESQRDLVSAETGG